MLNKQFQKVPLRTGTNTAWLALAGFGLFAAGWITHNWLSGFVCFFPV